MSVKIADFTVESEGREEKFVILFPLSEPESPAATRRRPRRRGKSKRAVSQAGAEAPARGGSDGG